MNDDTVTKNILTRRNFLKTGLAGSIAARGAVATASASASALVAASPATASAEPDAHQLGLARAAMDVIIPAGNGMPCASDVGGVEYLTALVRTDAEQRTALVRILTGIEALSHEQAGKGFIQLDPAQRVEVLTSFEKLHGDDFGALRDLVYQSYYTQPKVWKLIGYELHPTNESGPTMKPFNEDLLAEVRKKPPHFREAS